MTTKDNFLLFKDKQKSGNHLYNDFGAKHSDLNINQNLKGLNVFPMQSDSKSMTNKKIGSTLSEIHEEKSQAWKKSSKTDFCSKNSNSLSRIAENEKCWTKKESATNNSTLSIHIPASEDSSEVDESFQKSLVIQKQKQINCASELVSQNPFEFQRQQYHKMPEPQISHFKASQQLLDINRMEYLRLLQNGQRNISSSSSSFSSITNKQEIGLPNLLIKKQKSVTFAPMDNVKIIPNREELQEDQNNWSPNGTNRIKQSIFNNSEHQPQYVENQNQPSAFSSITNEQEIELPNLLIKKQKSVTFAPVENVKIIPNRQEQQQDQNNWSPNGTNRIKHSILNNSEHQAQYVEKQPALKNKNCAPFWKFSYTPIFQMNRQKQNEHGYSKLISPDDYSAASTNGQTKGKIHPKKGTCRNYSLSDFLDPRSDIFDDNKNPSNAFLASLKFTRARPRRTIFLNPSTLPRMNFGHNGTREFSQMSSNYMDVGADVINSDVTSSTGCDNISVLPTRPPIRAHSLSYEVRYPRIQRFDSDEYVNDGFQTRLREMLNCLNFLILCVVLSILYKLLA